MTASDLEAAFATLWKQLGFASEWLTEYRFAPGRRLRFDFAEPCSKVAVEMEGGTWSGGRHVRGAGFEADCKKYNLAASLGWTVYRLTASMLRDDPAGHLGMIARTIEEGTV